MDSRLARMSGNVSYVFEKRCLVFSRPEVQLGREEWCKYFSKNSLSITARSLQLQPHR
jgi:hypothetical protein